MFGLLTKKANAKGRIGVVLGREQVAIAVVRRDIDGAPILERCEALPVAAAAGADVVAQTLRAAGLPRMAASSVLHSEDYQLALVEAPDVPPAEMRAAMRWKLKDTIDFRVEDAVIDVFEVPNQSRGGAVRMLYAVAARRSVVDQHAASLAGLSSFDVVDMPELCLRNLAALTPAAANGVALLYLGETSVTVVLVRGSTFYFARQMDLQATMRGRLDSPGISSRIDASTIVLELQRSLDYYERHFDQPPITRVVIAPFEDRAEALATELARETGFDVTTFDVNAFLRCESPVDAATQATCLLAVGAALRQDPVAG